MFLYGTEAWTLRRKDKKTTDFNRDEILEDLKVEPADEKQKIQIKLTATSNRNEQRQDAKNNAELLAEWTKTTW
jgi:hypothetical protein